MTFETVSSHLQKAFVTEALAKKVEKELQQDGLSYDSKVGDVREMNDPMSIEGHLQKWRVNVG